MNEQQSMQVTHEWHIGRIVTLVALVSGLIVGSFAVFTSQELRSRATLSVSTPSPLVEIKPSPPIDLEAPYIRLVTNKQSYSKNDRVIVDIFVDTGNQPVMETDVVIVYDEKSLTLDESSVQNAPVFKSVQSDFSTKDQVKLSFFVTPSVGHKPIKTEGEVKIGSIVFDVLTVDKVEVSLVLKNVKEGSSLIIFTEERIESPLNVLQSMAGVTLFLNQ